MNRVKRIGAVLAAACVVAVSVGACGSDESREDANDVNNGAVDKSAPAVIAFNNHYPNVETKCHGFGHRLYVITHDSAQGQNLIVVNDPTCQGPGTGYSEIVRTGKQPPAGIPPNSDVPQTGFGQ